MTCPTPEKRRYISRRRAARIRRMTAWPRLRPYLCVCGFWHLGRLRPEVITGEISRQQAHRRP